MAFAQFGQHDDKTLAQMQDVASRAVKSAIMADGHVGYVMPIGGVAAYDNQVSVVGVGFDIACGNCAIKTDRRADSMTRAEIEALADEIQATISFGVGRSNAADDAPVDDPLFASDAWSLLPKSANMHNLQGKARAQLGTVGSGNHYVDVFTDTNGWLWVGVHFGSRGLGHTIASGFLALSQGAEWGARVPERETLLSLDTPLGADYWALMELAGQYAYAGREWVTRKVVSLLGANAVDMIHNHHNFAWLEGHRVGDDVRDVVVIRKGATPAFPHQRGFVGGSMGDDAVILEGVQSDRSAESLYSTVHGAGRVMSRTEARGKMKGWGKNAKLVAPGKVSWDMVREWIGPRGVVLRGGGLDESPHAYRRLPDVLAAQGDTIRVLETLTPIIVVMAGETEYDPYKD
jgi:tRNA-splicing ligase RtcB